MKQKYICLYHLHNIIGMSPYISPLNSLEVSLNVSSSCTSVTPLLVRQGGHGPSHVCHMLCIENGPGKLASGAKERKVKKCVSTSAKQAKKTVEILLTNYPLLWTTVTIVTCRGIQPTKLNANVFEPSSIFRTAAWQRAVSRGLLGNLSSEFFLQKLFNSGNDMEFTVISCRVLENHTWICLLNPQ